MKLIDKAMEEFLLSVLNRVDPDPDPVELDKPAGPKVPEEGGVENSGPDEVTLEDLSVRFAPKVLKDHLPVFGDPDDIIRIHRDNPEYLDARRVDDQGSNDPGDSDPGKARGKKQEKEDK